MHDARTYAADNLIACTHQFEAMKVMRTQGSSRRARRRTETLIPNPSNGLRTWGPDRRRRGRVGQRDRRLHWRPGHRRTVRPHHTCMPC